MQGPPNDSTLSGEGFFSDVFTAGKTDQSTSIAITERTKRWFFAAFLVFVAACSVWQAAVQARAFDSWIIGDWLINYSGGFIRRGLIGALVITLHRATGAPLEWIVFSIQTIAFLVFLGCVYQLSKGIRWSYLMVAVLLSPATLAFTVLDPSYAGLRKEILLFAGLALFVVVLVHDRLKDWQLIAVLSAILVGMTLSHEALLVAAPYLFAAVAVQTMSLRRAVRLCAIPFALAGLALIAVILRHGDLAMTQAICSSVGGQMNAAGVVTATGGICSGSIASLQLSASAEHAGIIGWIRDSHLLSLYGLFIVPTFAPLILLMWQFYRRDHLRYEVLVVFACFLVSLPGIAVLMYVGSDWGRWIHIEAVSLMLLAMMIDRRAIADSRKAEPARRSKVAVQALATLVVLLYVTTWTLPAIGTGYERQGYLSLVSPEYRKTMHDTRAAAVRLVKEGVGARNSGS